MGTNPLKGPELLSFSTNTVGYKDDTAAAVKPARLCEEKVCPLSGTLQCAFFCGGARGGLQAARIA